MCVWSRDRRTGGSAARGGCSALSREPAGCAGRPTRASAGLGRMMTKKNCERQWHLVDYNKIRINCAHGTRCETIDTITSLDCALSSNSRAVSGYWPIVSAMQISAASKSTTLCSLELRLVLI